MGVLGHLAVDRKVALHAGEDQRRAPVGEETAELLVHAAEVVVEVGLLGVRRRAVPAVPGRLAVLAAVI